MIVGVDGNEANVEKRVGVNVYAFELLCAIHKFQNEWKDKYHLIVYLKNPPLPDLPEETKFFKYKVIQGSGAWILVKLTPSLFFGSPRPDLFFSPSHYTPPFAPMPRVCSIMDLGYLKFSDQFTKITFWQLKWWSAISILVSKAVIAISNSTKKDIVRHYPFAKGKIYVTPLAYDKEKFNVAITDADVRRVRNKYSIVDDYILFLSTLKPSKNVEGLIEAFFRIAKKYPKINLVVAGKKGWLYQSIFDKADKLGLKDRIVYTDFVPEEDKPALIKGAKVFVLPSFWEGFGLDVLNAMACGVPVVASRMGSLPEVAGQAGIMVDPYDINSIAGGISSVLSMSKERYNNLVGKGLIQVRKYSWEKTARQTLEVFGKIRNEITI